MTDDLDAKLRKLEEQRLKIHEQLAATSSVLSDVEQKIKQLKTTKGRTSGGHEVPEKRTASTPVDSMPAFDEPQVEKAEDGGPLQLVPNKLTSEQVTIRPGDKIQPSHLSGNDSLEETRAAICVKDYNGVYLYANKTLHEFFNAAPGTIVGTMDSAWVSPGLAQTLRENDLRAIKATGFTEQVETADSAAGVSTHWYSFKFPIHATNGVLLGVIALEVTNLVASAGMDKAREVARTRFEKLSELKDQLMLMGRQLNTGKRLNDKR